MTVCFEQRPEFYDFFNQHSGTTHQPPTSQVIASLRGARIAAVVLYSRIARGACEMSIVTDGGRDWASAGFVRAAFEHPFKALNLNRCGVLIAESNSASIRLAVKLGFEMEGIARQYFDGEDAYLLGLMRDDCQWLHTKSKEKRHG